MPPRSRSRARRGSRAWPRWLAAVMLVAALATWHLTAAPPAAERAELPASQPLAAGDDRLIIEPDDGMAPIDALLASAHRSLDVTMYELLDPTAEAILADAAARGVQVRVVLDGRLERGRNAPAYQFLRGRGVAVSWSSDRYFATHEKAFVIDRTTAVIMSLNLTSRYYATTRDAAVVDEDPRDVAAIESVFDADLGGESTPTPAADDLVWSPGQSQADLLALINGARRSIDVESEELSSQVLVDALARAAHRGVAVRLAMTYQSQWAAGLDAVTAAGGTAAVMHGESPLYLHAKLLVVDAGLPGARAFVGSENLSDASLLHDRELGIVLMAPRLVDQIADLIESDVADGQRWR